MQSYESMRYRGTMQPYDPHYSHHDVWREFDEGVAKTRRRERRARFLAALRPRRKTATMSPSRPLPHPGRGPITVLSR